MGSKEKTPQRKIIAALKALRELRELLDVARAAAAKELEAQNERFSTDLMRMLRREVPQDYWNSGHLGGRSVETIYLVEAIRNAQELSQMLLTALAKVESAGGLSLMTRNEGSDGNEHADETDSGHA